MPHDVGKRAHKAIHHMIETNNQKVTVQDVAKMADVSVATVSRALFTPDKVADKTRQKVLKAVEITGYTVNYAARNLRRQKTDTIVILTPNIGNPYFSNIVEGIEEVCAANHISVLIADTQKATMNAHHTQSYFSRNRVDGILILDGQVSEDLVRESKGQPPIIFAGEWHPASEITRVTINDQLGAALAINHLYDLGHRAFGHIAGPLDHVPGQRRHAGFLKALHDKQLDGGNAWLFSGRFSLQTGYQAAQAWAELHPAKRPKAIFCAGDEIAIGFLAGLQKLGFSVPADVSVVGYDDLEVAEYTVPALTTIHQPRRALGRLAATALLQMINDEDLPANLELAPWLVTRESCTST